MKELPAALKAATIVAFVLVVPGSALATWPTGAANLPAILERDPSTLVQPAHCRRFVHAHRICVRWRRGACRAWRVIRHRC